LVYRRENKMKELRARRGRDPGPMRKDEEKEKIHWKRRAGQNWGMPTVWTQEMKEAKVNPLPNKVFKPFCQPFHPLAQVEQKKRREVRKERGETAELNFNQAKTVVQSSGRGLWETGNLKQRVQLLRKSIAKDRQCITTSLLAKTLAYMGDMEEAKVEMHRWKEFTGFGRQMKEKHVERSRWREAHTKLKLFLCQRKNVQTDLREGGHCHSIK